jgi:trigger factor
LNVTVETTLQSEAQFHIQLPWSEIDKRSEQVYRRLAQQHNVPGFRPGRAPRPMIERMFGRDAIYEEAIDYLVQDAVRRAADENEMTLLAAPHAHVHTINHGQEHDVTVTLPVLQKGELGDYSDISVEREAVEVSEEDIDHIIENAQKRMAVWVPVERSAELGDRVTIDLLVKANDKEISNYKDQEFTLVDDRTGLFTGMDDEIIGMKDGETKEFTTTIPEDYGNADYAGKTANYTVTLNKTTVQELPAVDDEFAKSAGDFDSVESMREGVRRDLIQQRENTARRHTRDRVYDALVERLTLTVPEVLIDAEVQTMMENITSNLGPSMKLDDYLSLIGKDKDSYSQELRPEAERAIKVRRALELVAQREGLDATTDEIQVLLDAYATINRSSRTRVSQLSPSQRQSIQRNLLREKAEDLLIERYTTAPTGDDSDEPVPVDSESDSSADEVDNTSVATLSAGVETDKES